jgi:co-chaperonin GroES (HSP10)
MYLKMRNGNVALELLDEQSQTPSGLFIPQTVRKGNLQCAKVFATGPGELIQGTFVQMDIEKDDEVVFDITHSEPITVDGKTLYVCNMVDVVAIISAKHLSIVPSAK